MVCPDERRSRRAVARRSRSSCWTSSGGVSPLRGSVGAPGSRSQARGGIPVSTRDVESLKRRRSRRDGAQARRPQTSSEASSLVTETIRKPSRSFHGEGHAHRAGSESRGGFRRSRKRDRPRPKGVTTAKSASIPGPRCLRGSQPPKNQPASPSLPTRCYTKREFLIQQGAATGPGTGSREANR